MRTGGYLHVTPNPRQYGVGTGQVLSKVDVAGRPMARLALSTDMRRVYLPVDRNGTLVRLAARV